MRRIPFGLALVLASTMSGPSRAAEPPAFEWKDGDRVVLIGDTLIERDQRYGYLETWITAANPDEFITFRNLGWSGDTVRGLSRARFGPPAEGFQHLKDHVNALKPTVLIVGYGMADSFDGEAGLVGFVSGMNELLDAVTASKPRLIFLSPIAHEDLGRPLPDPAAHNQSLERYRDAIKKVAGERSGWFVDLYMYSDARQAFGDEPLTADGIQPTAFGHWALASFLDRWLRRSAAAPSWDWAIDSERGVVLPPKSAPVSAWNFQRTPEGIRFEVTYDLLPPLVLRADTPAAAKEVGSKRTLRVLGLKPGRYTLSADGRPIGTADDREWGEGVRYDRGPEADQVEALRAAINAKNALYFYRWRPQNETYLFGFRKHEQGNNAREIPLFDPLVEEKEREIARLKEPVPHVYVLKREVLK